MASREIEIRNAVAAELATGTFSIAFNVLFGGPTYHDVDETSIPRVFVTVLQTSPEPVTRNAYRETYKLGVTVTDYLERSTQEEIDDMILLVQQIRDYLKNRLYPDGWHFSINEGGLTDLYDLVVHETNNFFVSYLEFEYQNHVLVGAL